MDLHPIFDEMREYIHNSSSKTEKVTMKFEYSGYVPIVDIICPFCDHLIQHIPEDLDVKAPSPCDHLIFIAHDDGEEYISDNFSKMWEQIKKETDDDETGELSSAGFDGMLDRVKIPGSVKLAIYNPAPSFFGIYYGFAPKR